MAALHPQIVHFAVALLVIGVLLRLVSWLGRPAFVSPAATLLLVLGTGAAVLAVYSGDAAHGPVERMPGVRQAVVEHEAWGERTRNVFLAVIVAEALMYLLGEGRRRYALMASAIVGSVGLVCLYQAGEHGGRLVYGYAGGVGVQGQDPKDVGRLLLAGLYQQAQADRFAGKHDLAAELVEQAGKRFPDAIDVQLMVAESHLLDRRDAGEALTRLRAITPPRENRSLRIQHALLTADALDASGQRDGAAALLQALLTEFPTATRVQSRLESLRLPSTQP